MDGVYLSNEYAHDGRMSSKGCHNSGKVGDYYCHNSEYLKPPPRKSNRNYFGGCVAVSVAPLRRGGSGYRSGLDRDNEEITCE